MSVVASVFGLHIFFWSGLVPVLRQFAVLAGVIHVVVFTLKRNRYISIVGILRYARSKGKCCIFYLNGVRKNAPLLVIAYCRDVAQWESRRLLSQ